MNEVIIFSACFVFAVFIYLVFFNEKSLISKKDKAYAFNIKQNIGVFLVCMIVSVSSIFIYDNYFATKIVKLDMTQYINDIQKKYMAEEITMAEVDKRLAKMKNIIESQKPNKILILSDMVVSKNVETIKVE